MIIVASVSCIFGLGSPQTYEDMVQILKPGDMVDRDDLLTKLVQIQYTRNDAALGRGNFRVRGDTLEVFPAYAETAYRATLFGDEIERLQHFDPLTGEILEDELEHLAIWPATHYNVREEELADKVAEIGAELNARCAVLESEGKMLESHRLRQRTQYDMEMLRELGFCSGIENYSRILDGRAAGQRPYCLIDYFPSDFVCFIDESHQTVPQIGGMYEGDSRASARWSTTASGCRARWTTGPRPSTSSLDHAADRHGLGDPWRVRAHPLRPRRRADRAPDGHRRPAVEVRETRNQIDDLMNEIRERVEENERVLVTTLTKKMSEDLTDYLLEMGFKVRYLHSEIDTLERIQIIRDLRLGEYDVLVGCEPPARGPRPAGGVADRHSRRGQGGLPARRDVAHPDDRPGGAQRARQGGHVRRQGDRRHAGGDPGDRPPARDPGRLQRGARDHARDDRQGHLRHHGLPRQQRVQGPEERRRSRNRDAEHMEPAEIERTIVELEEEMLAAARTCASCTRPSCATRSGRCAATSTRRAPALERGAAALVRRRAARPALEADARPVPDPRLGGDAPADAGRPRAAVLRALAGGLPDEAALARASAADVLRLWSGLGYNRRALALQRACARRWR